MKYLGWIISIVLIAVFAFVYQTRYRPLKRDIDKLESEIEMWESVLKGEKGLTGDRNRFPVERFFEGNRLTPYAEVEMLRRFDPGYKGIEIYVSAYHPLERAREIVRFFAEQRIEYRQSRITIEADSIERFEYKFMK